MRRTERNDRVPGGAAAAPDGDLYELSGGELCLDFANTVDSRPTDEPRELLATYDQLLRWSVQAEALAPDVAKRLRAKAARHERQAAAALRRAQALREAIFEIFSAVARGASPPAAGIELLNERIPEALSRLRIAGEGTAYGWDWENDDSLDRMLWPVVRSAASLLTSDRLDRVRECAADDCAWLFLDQSRNRSRRWCDMTVCGNRSKVRRFRQSRRAD